MALIKCPECEKEISDKAAACPHCGCPIDQIELPNNDTLQINEKKGKGNGCLIAILVIPITLIFMVLLLAQCGNNHSSYNKPITTNCYWCGKKEECYTYELQYVSGYNPNGSFKFEYDVKSMSSSCAEKCKNSGKYTNVKKVN